MNQHDRKQERYGAKMRLLLAMPIRAAVTCIMLIAATAMTGLSAPGGSSQTLVIAYYREADTLNGYAARTPTIQEMNAVEGFATADGKMQYVPREVQQIPTTRNGGVRLLDDGQMIVTWKLKPGLKWSDGQPATSADAAFTYQALVNPEFRVSNRSGWRDITKVETPDPLTVRVTFQQPFVAYNDLFRYLLPKHLLEGKDLNTFAGYNRSPLTTGPYMVTEWIPGQQITIVANPYYRDANRGVPHIKQIVWRFVSDDNTRINMLRTGEAQIAWVVPFAQSQSLRSSPRIVVHSGPTNGWMHFDFNFRQPIFRDLSLRQAVAYAVNKEAIVKEVLGGLAKPAGPPMSPLSWAYNPYAYSQYNYDPTRARKLIESAGWKLGANGIYEKDGRPLTFTNCANTGDSTQDKVQLVIQANLRAIGMDMQIQNYAAAIFSAIRIEGKCDTLFHRWLVPPTPALALFYSIKAEPPNGFNHLYYENAQLSDLLDSAESMVDQSKAKSLFWQAQLLLAQDLPSIPIYYLFEIHASTDRLQGYVWNPTNNGFGWNSEDWTLKP